jgi:lysylphosphatidylglycerol synthetase-like protein (DUF2156 family)
VSDGRGKERERVRESNRKAYRKGYYFIQQQQQQQQQQKLHQFYQNKFLFC